MPFAARPHFDWKLRTRTLTLGERTRIMAIVNLTPDSFSGDGLLSSPANGPWQHAVEAAVAALDGGADIVDLGAESTRPNAVPLTSMQEQDRLLRVLEAVHEARPAAIISVDTYHAATAQAALAAGAEIVNDVSGLLWDAEMPTLLAQSQPGLVLMHTRGRPQEWETQQRLAPQDVVAVVLDGLRERVDFARSHAIAKASIVLDPGFGFGKRGAENFSLLAGFAAFAELGYPLLAGVSRKGFLAQAVAGLQQPGQPAAIARLHATTAANVAAILAGAHILRVHDLQPAREAAAIADALLAAT